MTMDADDIEVELDNVMDEVRDAVVQLAATYKASATLRAAAEMNFKVALKTIHKFILSCNP